MELQNPKLRQRGRASVDFLTQLGKSSMQVGANVNADMEAAGVTAETVPDDIDAAYDFVDSRMAGSKAFAVKKLMGDWHSRSHGVVAAEAFEEIESELAPAIKNASDGPARLTLSPEMDAPDYWDGVHFHRTAGGWDGHPHMGYIHGEIIHKKMVDKLFPGGIFKQRKMVAEMAPRDSYERILDMGCSSGHYTTALAQTYPDAKITGIDLSPRMLEHAHRTANTNRWDWDLYERAAEDTGFDDNSFDLVTSYIVLHEVPADAIRAIFAEAFRVLTPGGDMLMSDVTRYADLDNLARLNADRGARSGGEPHWRSSASADLAELAREAGFENATAEGKYPHVVQGRKPA